MVEYAKAEAEENRGRAQTLLQMVNTAGYFVSVTIVAFGFNGRMFTGSFNQRHQLSYQEAMGIVAVMCTGTGALCAIKVHERPAESASLRDYSRSSWHLLESKARSQKFARGCLLSPLVPKPQIFKSPLLALSDAGLLCCGPLLLRQLQHLQYQHDCESVGGARMGKDRKHAEAALRHAGCLSQPSGKLAYSKMVSGSQLAKDHLRDWGLNDTSRCHSSVLHDLRCHPEPVFLSW